MICFWWTGSPQVFFWENTKWKKVSYPHYLKIVIKLSKHGLSYSLKRDLRSISKITFCANSSVKSYWYRALFFSKNCIFFPRLKDCQANPSNSPHSDQCIAAVFVWKVLKSLYPIGIKCDFRDWPRITFDTIAEAMFA